MKKIDPDQSYESIPAPHFVRDFSPKMIELLKQHFWCDFSDINPALSWDETKTPN